MLCIIMSCIAALFLVVSLAQREKIKELEHHLRWNKRYWDDNIAGR